VFTAVQRFRSDLGLYVHLHCLLTDGTLPHLASPQGPATRPPLTVSAFGMQLHAATTVDGQGPQAAGAHPPNHVAPAVRP